MTDSLREMTVGTGAGLDTADMVLNIGPQHPSTHGVLRLRLVLDGERIVSAEPVIGYMHRGAEKLFEARDYRQIIMLANRHDWLSAFSNELGVVLADVRVAVASHNLRSVSHAIAYNRLLGGDDSDLELQVLRGLGDELQDALAAGGFRVRTYCPVGDLVAGMAYLVRRLLENTSNESCLSEQARGVPLEQLLAAP